MAGTLFRITSLQTCTPMRARPLQCFNSGKSFASSSSNDIEPSTFAPLMKKVGVAPTFNWLWAKVCAACSLSSMSSLFTHFSTSDTVMPNLAPIAASVSVVCSTRSCCCLNSIMVASKNFDASPLAAQRASIEAAAALKSSGKSRDTKRTFPVSIYRDCSIGKTFCANAVQCGQVSEEYSTIVIGAVSDARAMSGSATGFATKAAIPSSLTMAVGAAKPQAVLARVSVVRTSATNSARRDNSNERSFGFRPPHRRETLCGCRAERLEPGGSQVRAGRHQAERQGETKAGKHRDRPERAIGSNGRNHFHFAPLLAHEWA